MMSAAYRSFWTWLVLTCLLWGCFLPCAAQQSVPHVIHVSVDGLSAIYLNAAMTNDPEQYPNFRRLLNEGSGTLNARCDFDYSETMPNHTCMLLGRPVLQPAGWPDTAHHGITYNSWDGYSTFHNSGNPAVEYFASVFDVVHDHGLSTAFFAGKWKLAICYVSYNETNGAPDLIGEDNGPNKVDFAQILDYRDYYDRWDLTEAVTNYLADHAPNYLFIHIADLDYTGHFNQWGSAYWNVVLSEIDLCLGSLFDAIARNPDLASRTTMIVTTDHGGGYPSNTHVYAAHPLNYTIPFMVWGPGWPAGADLHDVLVNRYDPGTNRLDYTASHQPMRNGDAANLALTLLGLPPVPGSSLIPTLRPKVALSCHDSPLGLIISWPSPSTGYKLESSDSLLPSATWESISNGIMDNGMVKTYVAPYLLGHQLRFFRLRLVQTDNGWSPSSRGP